jgi:hypothetical protein
MPAVVAAIVAGILAGGVALLREHRIQERRLLVAARVMDEMFSMVNKAIGVSLSTNGWGAVNAMPTRENFSRCWEESRADLAGHLTHEEWKVLSRAVSYYEATRSTSFTTAPKDVEEDLRLVAGSVGKARDRLKPYVMDRFTLPRQAQRRRRRGGWAS